MTNNRGIPMKHSSARAALSRCLIAASVLVALQATAQAEQAPYAGLETRDIAALSPSDINDLLNGRGWGFALAAELNGFPGPTHVLELANELDLTVAQSDQIERIRQDMAEEAKVLGAAFVSVEAELDSAFEDATITTSALTDLTTRAATIEAELRAVHLAAHLDVTPLLSRHQIVTYNRLRGYGDAEQSHGGGGHGNH